MDAHVHLVVVLIHYAYHLLIGVARGDAHQSGELADAEIHMHDIVAGVHFLQLLHRESHLSAARRVGTQTVFMETVEYLVVGEHADAQGVVGKATVERLLHRLKGHRFGRNLRAVGHLLVLRHLVEDVAQTLVLLLAVGKDIQLIPFQRVVFERAQQEVKVLVEKRLRGGVESDGSLWRAGGRSPELDALEPCHAFGEDAARDEVAFHLHLLHYLALLHLGSPFEPFGHGLLGEALAVGVFYHVMHEGDVLRRHKGVFGQELEEGNLFGNKPGKLRHDVHLVHLSLGELRLHLKGAYCVYLVAEEIYAVGVLVTE